MNKKKLFNDPIYGLIDFPQEIYYEIIDHRYFQRLRRIGQMGLTNLVYPGATNTRFHHALGALYLMTRALDVLRSKGVDISLDEERAVCLAILLHDIGHGPFSHALEGLLIRKHHEDLSKLFMKKMNGVYGGELDLCIAIFEDKYPRHFLHQLVSSQLDVDRMDYLMRDTYYTGVAEGVIGYDRLIKMLNVVDNQLVVEEKGVYSVDKFLVARTLMYWQVYLHKTSIAAENMLKCCVERMMYLREEGVEVSISSDLARLLDEDDEETLVERFSRVDDMDVYMMLKNNRDHEDFVINEMCNAILDRRLHRVIGQSTPFSGNEKEKLVLETSNHFGIAENMAEKLILSCEVDNTQYDESKEEISILTKNRGVLPYSRVSNSIFSTNEIIRYYICTPRI